MGLRLSGVRRQQGYKRGDNCKDVRRCGSIGIRYRDVRHLKGCQEVRRCKDVRRRDAVRMSGSEAPVNRMSGGKALYECFGVRCL
jgi:hypothetical protein